MDIFSLFGGADTSTTATAATPTYGNVSTQIFANSAATNGGSAITGNTGVATVAPAANLPQAPTMFTGGNLVNSVNASYQNQWQQLQNNYSVASNSLQAAQQQIVRKQKDLADAQAQWQYYDDIVKLWEGRHSGCGPFSDYGCGECDAQTSGNGKNRDAAQLNIDAAKNAIADLQNQISTYLQPQLNYANTQLQNSYTNYRTDIAAAQKQEAAAAKSQADTAAQNQNTALQSNPEYVAAQNAAKAAAAAADLAKQKQADKQQMIKYIVAGAVVILLGVLVVVALRIKK